ncbi:MAG: glycosyl hydrolase family 18 protein [Eubacteriaceae bacterium]
MQIHVVRPGDSLWGMSQAYSISADEIAKANEISDPNRLVIGQALVIPITGSFYWVMPRDSLYSISRKLNVPINVLVETNNITNPNQLVIGTRLYIPPAYKPSKEASSYIDVEMTSENTEEEVNKVGELLTYLNIFSYSVNRDGTLTPTDDTSAINAAKNNGILPLLVITNYEDGTFSQDLATTILSNEELQNKLLNNALKIMQEKGYKGIDFDFEYLGKDNRVPYNEFVTKAANFFQPKGYYVSSALAPKISSTQVGTLYEGHDYAAHGEVLDFIFIMTYEWGWSGGPPYAVAPINEVRKVMNYTVTQIPRNKIMMGIPLYGYDWTLPYVKGGKWAKVVSPQQAIEIAANHGAVINYDYSVQSPYFNYYDNEGNQHIVWFEDARSIQAKFNLVKNLGIRGFYYWALGPDFPQNWLLIEDNFNIVKK